MLEFAGCSSATGFLKLIRKHSADYNKALSFTLDTTRLNTRLDSTWTAIKQDYPNFTVPDNVYFTIGNFTTKGTTYNKRSVMIGLDAFFFRNNQTVSSDEIISTIIHEAGHLQDRSFLLSKIWGIATHGTLYVAILEGSADFLAMKYGRFQLAADENYVYLSSNKAQVITDFKRECLKNNYKRWFYSRPKGPNAPPVNMGYAVGNYVCQVYYDNTQDKQTAFGHILDQRHVKRIYRRVRGLF